MSYRKQEPWKRDHEEARTEEADAALIRYCRIDSALNFLNPHHPHPCLLSIRTTSPGHHQFSQVLPTCLLRITWLCLSFMFEYKRCLLEGSYPVIHVHNRINHCTIQGKLLTNLTSRSVQLLECESFLWYRFCCFYICRILLLSWRQ